MDGEEIIISRHCRLGGGSSTAEQLSFQIKDGGSIPTSPLRYVIKECRFRNIRHIFEKYHDKGGHMGGGISVCLVLLDGEHIVGGAVMGKPRHNTKYSLNGKRNVIEIRRMALLDECPKNSESYFLGKIIWYLKKNTNTDDVMSYADLSVGHIGTIYKAANFKLIGYTAPGKHVFWNGVRYHPRSLTIDRPYSYRMREAVKTGEAVVKTGEPKAIYKYQIMRG